MPELPEVITIRNDLRKEIIGKKVISVDSFDGFPYRPSKRAFEELIHNFDVIDVSNVAKMLYIMMSSQTILAIHLRMTGNLLYNNTDKYVKLKINFGDNTFLSFSEVRKFGYMEVWDITKLSAYRKKFGKDILESDLTDTEFIKLILKRKAPIKNALLNQKIISGVGNIYANDALYISKIHPEKPANKLSHMESKKLYHNLLKVLLEGVKNRGSSIDRYKDIYGKPGEHQNHFYVYGKKDQLCKNCKTYAIIYKKIAGRGTFYCPYCQRA